MNMLALGIATYNGHFGEIPLRDSCVLAFFLVGSVLLLAATYLLFTSPGPDPVYDQDDPARRE